MTCRHGSDSGTVHQHAPESGMIARDCHVGCCSKGVCARQRRVADGEPQWLSHCLAEAGGRRRSRVRKGARDGETNAGSAVRHGCGAGVSATRFVLPGGGCVRRSRIGQCKPHGDAGGRTRIVPRRVHQRIRCTRSCAATWRPSFSAHDDDRDGLAWCNKRVLHSDDDVSLLRNEPARFASRHGMREASRWCSV